MNTFLLTVSTPFGNALCEDAVSIVLRGAEGDLAILAGHIPFITTVKAGTCRVILPDGSERNGRCDGGLLTVSESAVTLLAGTFEWNK